MIATPSIRKGAGVDEIDQGEDKMAFVVTARWVAAPGNAETVAECIRNLIALSRAEPGVIVYQAHRAVDDDHVFLLYEQYRSEDDYRLHGESEHFQTWGHGKALALLAARERAFYETWEG